MMLPSSLIAEAEQRLIDIDYPHATEAKVEVNLAGALFALAAKAMGDEDPETADLLSDLESVRIRIYDKAALGGRSFDQVLSFYRKQLQKPTWDVLARVKERESTVGVYSASQGDVVAGLVVLVGNPAQVIVASLAGRINIAKLSQVDKITGVNLNLSELDLDKRLGFDNRLSPKKKKRQRELRAQVIRELFWGEGEGDREDKTLALLEKLEKEGLSDSPDYMLMAALYESRDTEKTYYYLSKAYNCNVEELLKSPPSMEEGAR
jgi:hypothetical protein